MRAIFVARGPAFPHQPHSRIDAFGESICVALTNGNSH